MVQRQHGLDQAGNPCSHIEMSDIRLDGSDRAELRGLRSGTKSLRQRGDLDWVAKRRSRAVSFNVRDRVRRDVTERLRHLNNPGLTVHTRRGEARFVRPVVVQSKSFDHRENVVAPCHRIFEPPQRHNADSVAEQRSCRVLVERPAVAICGDHAAFFVDVGVAMGKIDRHTTSERKVTFETQQALAGVTHRHKRRRACRLHANRRPSQVQLVGHPSRQKVLLVEHDRRKDAERPQNVRT